MLALLGANPFLGLSQPDWRLAYLFLGIVAGIGVFLYIMYGMRKLKERQRLKRSSWNTYYKIAKLKGLTQMEADTLAAAIRQAGIRRPSQVLGAIKVFDQCVDQAVARGQLDVNQQTLLSGVRQRLLTVARDWDGQQRRNQERAAYPLAVRAALMTREELEEQQLKSGSKTAEVKEVLARLFAAQEHGHAQLMDISAGGMALMIRDDERLRAGDYVHLAPEADAPPVDLNELIGEVVTCERLRDQEQLILHLRFLPYPPQVKKEIIRLVYEKNTPPAKAPRGKAPLAGKADAAG